MMAEHNIVDRSADKVKAEYANSQMDYLHYHNWPHTMLVWQHAKELALNSENITPQEIEALELAAVYHDIGHAFGSDNTKKIVPSMPVMLWWSLVINSKKFL